MAEIDRCALPLAPLALVGDGEAEDAFVGAEDAIAATPDDEALAMDEEP